MKIELTNISVEELTENYSDTGDYGACGKLCGKIVDKNG